MDKLFCGKNARLSVSDDEGNFLVLGEAESIEFDRPPFASGDMSLGSTPEMYGYSWEGYSIYDRDWFEDEPEEQDSPKVWAWECLYCEHRYYTALPPETCYGHCGGNKFERVEVPYEEGFLE